MPASIRHTATLVLAENDQDSVRQIADALVRDRPYKTLCPGKAFEYELDCEDAKAAQSALRSTLDAHNLRGDICVQPSDNRRKPLLICDMDSTLIGQECIDELADFAGLKAEVSAITERAMRGEIDFEDALINRVKLLKNLPLSTLQTCFDQRITLNTGARTLARTMKANGATTVIVSGGFTFFTERIAAQAGFDAHHANVLLECRDDPARPTLSGGVARPILGRQAKLERLLAYTSTASQTPHGPSSSLAIGDGANDLAMIEAAGLGIAYYAKPAVAAAAHCAITCTDLTTALYFQGYAASEFVT